MSDADRLRAITALNSLLSGHDAVEFKAHLDHPKKEFYWVTAHVGPADVSVLVSEATQLPLIAGRFRHSIQEILEALEALGVTIYQFNITEVDTL